MSTAELYLQPDEVEAFIQETLADDLLYSIGDEGREIGLCPFISFYIYNKPDEYIRRAEQMIAIFKEFESEIIDAPFELIWKGETQEWLKPGDPKLPADLRPYVAIAHTSARPVWLRATDMEGPTETPRWAINAIVDDGVGGTYSELKLTFRHHWYRQNQAKWHGFIERCLRRLTPDHCYSGFEVGNGGFNILGAYECDVLERICADYFFGMDVDHPSAMAFHNFNDTDGIVMPGYLGAGIRTPTWCFMLSPYWQARLGKTEAQIRAELNDPRIHITAIPYPVNDHYPQGGNGLWIRLGELDLYPIKDGVPNLLVKASKLIKPVRCDGLQLLTLDPWADDPNPRFDYQSSVRWMQRFDDDSDWPSPEQRLPAPGSAGGSTATQSLRALPGQAVPRAGIWSTPAVKGAAGRRRLAAGEKLPDLALTDYGAVVWYWSAEDQG
jgi:hypothetical protein